MTPLIGSAALAFGGLAAMLGIAMALGFMVGGAALLVTGELRPTELSRVDRVVAVADLGLPLFEFRTVADRGMAGERLLPDPTLTPGAVVEVDLAEMCQIGYAASVRDVPRERRDEVFREYGVARRDRRDYELDHLLSLSLGGSNSAENLWAQSRVSEPWNAEVKDTLEDVLHREVCSGRVSREEAQEAIRTDWIAAYRKFVGPDPIRFVPRSSRRGDAR
jgi:hypothetical protein